MNDNESEICDFCGITVQEAKINTTTIYECCECKQNCCGLCYACYCEGCNQDMCRKCPVRDFGPPYCTKCAKDLLDQKMDELDEIKDRLRQRTLNE